MADFEKLSQRELIFLAGVFRVDYKDKIDKSLFRELNSICHHQEKINPYNGSWSQKTRNYVIHQIYNKIITDKEERGSFIEKHPLEEINTSLKEVMILTAALGNQVHHENTNLHHENTNLQEKLEQYDSLEKKSIKEIGEMLRESRKGMLCGQSFIRHLDISILRPLVSKGWVLKEHITIPTHRSGWVNIAPVKLGMGNPYAILNKEFVYDGVLGSIPFEGVRNEDILDRQLPNRLSVHNLKELSKKLLLENNEIKIQNKHLEQDNAYLKSLIKKNNISL